MPCLQSILFPQIQFCQKILHSRSVRIIFCTLPIIIFQQPDSLIPLSGHTQPTAFIGNIAGRVWFANRNQRVFISLYLLPGKLFLSELLTTMLYPFSENEYNLLPFLSYKVLEPLYMTNVPF